MIKFCIKQILVLAALGWAIGFLASDTITNLALLKEGDIIFQETNSEQAKAIQLATHSRYTHVGILFKQNNTMMVFEAVQPVKITPLADFIKRGVDAHFVIKRLKNTNVILNKENIAKMKMIGKSYLGKNYDMYFEWSDEKIYCSELVWKIYKKALNIEVGKLTKLKDFDLSNSYVKNLMKKRYGKHSPLNELVISPEAIYQADNLVNVMKH